MAQIEIIMLSVRVHPGGDTMTAKNAGTDTVRLISLNMAGGMHLGRLLKFVSDMRGRVDIFCFQETIDGLACMPDRIKFTNGTYEAVKSRLKGFKAYTTEPYTRTGLFLSMFVRGSIDTITDGSAILVKPKWRDLQSWSRLQYAEIGLNGKRAVVAHLHGLYIPNQKPSLHYLDTKERLQQSKKALFELSRFNEPALLCGDFNLKQDTRSVAMFERKMRNLVKENGIKTTRNSLALPGSYGLTDYVFVSRGIRISEFKVLRRNVSDHLPIYVRFSLE